MCACLSGEGEREINGLCLTEASEVGATPQVKSAASPRPQPRPPWCVLSRVGVPEKPPRTGGGKRSPWEGGGKEEGRLA